MKLKINDLVTFKKNMYADENNAVYRVLEINDDRCIIELVNTCMVIRPQSVAILSDFELYTETDSSLNI